MKILLVGLALLFLSGCATKGIEVTTVSVDKAPLILPAVDRFQTRDIQWYVVTPDNYQATIKQLRAAGKNVALFALTDKGYQDLGLNLADIQTIVRQQQAIIEAMQEYYMLTGEEPVIEDAETGKKSDWTFDLF
jgi:hypothetical protein